MRVDLPDYLRNVAYMVRELQRAQKALILPHPMPGAAAEIAGFVLSDFDTDPASIGTTTVTILVPATTARAILAEVADGAVHPGQMAEDELGAATLTLATASFSLGAGVYDVYVRWLISPTNPGARAYWNATTTTENSQTKDMDDQAIMELGAVATGAAPPWGGGLLIASVTLNAINVITGYTDRRPMLFEGAADAAVAWEPGWGDGANDRNAARGTHGVKDLSTFVRFCRRQIEDILGGANRAWSVINGVLPTLNSLGTDHWYEGIGGAAEGHHRADVSMVATAPGTVRLRWQDSAGLAFVAEKTIADRWLAFYDGLGFGPTTAIKIDAPGSPGGLVISGPNGPGAPLANAGETAHIRFGEMIAGAGWVGTQDFALVAHGAPVDAGRQLEFVVGDGGGVGGTTAILQLNGDGGVVAPFLFQTPGSYTYSPTKTVWRSVGAADFAPVDDTTVLGVPLSPSGVRLSFLPLAAPPLVDVWARVALEDNGAQPQVMAGWGISGVAAVSGRITDPALSKKRLSASLAWLPNGAQIQAGDAVTVRVEATAAWKAVNTQRLALAIYKLQRATNAVSIVAYAQIDTTAHAAGYQIANAVWAGVGTTINHSTHDYFMLVQPDDTQVPPVAVTGEIGFTEVAFAFQVATFSH